MAEDNLTNIIGNLKDMLKNNKETNNNENSGSSNSSNSNLNISPEMISNLASMLQTSNLNSQNTGNTTANNFNNSNSSADNNGLNGIDFETILKIKSVMETLNKKDDPRSNLLYSLKPYLRESKQKKLDQYVNLFKITQVTNLFKNEKGDEN